MTPRAALNLDGLRTLDAGLATELEARGCDLSGPLWSASVLRSNPEEIQAVHRSFLQAGADCIASASYQVSRRGFRELGLTDADADRALRDAVALAVGAREELQGERPVWVAASLGPYGAALHNGAEYHGRYAISQAELTEFHRERIAVLAATEADFFLFETVPSLAEAEAIVEALRSTPELAACLSFVCGDGEHVAHGERLAACVALADRAEQVVAVGVNCIAPSLAESLLAILRAGTKKRIAVYPNSGESWDAATRSWSGQADVEAFGRAAAGWRAAGADWVGGCCRTGPAHLRTVAAR